MKIEIPLFPKQKKAFEILTSEKYKKISVLAYGGGGRSGKTWLGANWITSQAIRFPSSHWAIGREELKKIKDTTLLTLFKVFSENFGLTEKIDYVYNEQLSRITFKNGSIIFLVELKLRPRDPFFDRFGSYDLTGLWIDEAQEISVEARDYAQTRLSYLSSNDQKITWKTVAKTLWTFNPKKNWIANDVFKPFKEGKLEPHIHFIPALFTDNFGIDQSQYKKTVMNTKNKSLIERLLFGNFDYEDDPLCIFDFDAIGDLVSNKKQVEKNILYLTGDLARYGDDKVVIGFWRDWHLEKIFTWRKKGIDFTVSKIKKIAHENNVGRSNILLDEVNIGGGVIDFLKGSRGFNGGASQILSIDEKRLKRADKSQEILSKYGNLRAQCIFGVAKLVFERKVSISDQISKQDRDLLFEDLEYFKQREINSEKSIFVEKKEDMKKKLGRSPDFGDMFFMRYYFNLIKVPNYLALLY